MKDFRVLEDVMEVTKTNLSKNMLNVSAELKLDRSQMQKLMSTIDVSFRQTELATKKHFEREVNDLVSTTFQGRRK